MENVPGMLSAKPGNIKVTKELKKKQIKLSIIYLIIYLNVYLTYQNMEYHKEEKE
jgi:hypothetical protein